MQKKKSRLRDRAARIAGIVQTLQQMFQSVQEFSKWSLHKFGLTGPQIWALNSIETAGSMGMGELAQAMYLHISTVSGMVERLRRRGYVRCERDPRDRRTAVLTLTATGRAVLATAPPPPRGLLPEGLKRLDNDKLESIESSLQRLCRIMNIERTSR